MIILISGTPGTGKSVVSKLLKEKLGEGYVIFHLSSFLIQNRAYTEYDEERQTYIIDEEKAEKLLGDFFKTHKDVIVETVYPGLVPKADKVIVLRRNPLTLYEELKRRGWSELKVAENVMAEILGSVSEEAKEYFDNYCELDTTNKSWEDVVEKVLKGECESVDWLSDERVQQLLLSLDKIISQYEDSSL